MLKIGVLFEKENYDNYDMPISVYKPLCLVPGFFQKNGNFTFQLDNERFEMRAMSSNDDHVVDLFTDLDNYIVDNQINKALLDMTYGNILLSYYSYSFQKIKYIHPTRYSKFELEKLLNEHGKNKQLKKEPDNM